MKHRIAICAVAGMVVLLAGCMSANENTALKDVNADRAANHAAALSVNEMLVNKAESWAQGLLAGSGNVCLASSLHHSTLSTGAPAGWKELGENVGCLTSPNSADAEIGPLEAGFMASPGHRANIVNPAFNYGGMGVASETLPSGEVLLFEVQEFAQL